MKIIGKKIASFKTKDNQIKEYVKLYVVFEHEKIEGHGAEEITVKPNLIHGLNIGDEINFYYNKYGKVEKVEKI